MLKILPVLTLLAWWVNFSASPAHAQDAPPRLAPLAPVSLAEGATLNLPLQVSNRDLTGLIAQPRIVVLGSSTAEGAGISPELRATNSWVGRLNTHLTRLGVGHTLTNLAKSGYSTSVILDESTPGRQPIDPERNITKALSLNPHIIIINLPSNDVAAGLPNDETLANYRRLKQLVARQTVDGRPIQLLVTTTQPRNFGTDALAAARRRQQLSQAELIKAEFGPATIPLFHQLADVQNDYRIDARYDVGDGIHVFETGHQVIFEQVREALRPHVEGRFNYSFQLAPALPFAKVQPGPAGQATLQLTPKFNDAGQYQLNIQVYDGQGRYSNSVLSLTITERAPNGGQWGGSQTVQQVSWEPNGAPALGNCLVYFPREYDDDPNRRWPILFVLHGSEGFGNQDIAAKLTGPGSLVGTPAWLAHRGQDFPMIVVSPQQDAAHFAPGAPNRWNTAWVFRAVQHYTQQLRADNDRVYFTAYGLGAAGVLQFGQQYPAWLTAAWLVSPAISTFSTPAAVCPLKHLPFLAWQSENDEQFPLADNAAAFVARFNQPPDAACGRTAAFPARLNTGRPADNLGHTATIAQAYGHFGPDNGYQWLLGYRKNLAGNTSLVANAPVTTTWMGTSWSNGRPNAWVNAVIANGKTYPSGAVGEGSFPCRDLRVEPGGFLQIANGQAIEVNGQLSQAPYSTVVVEPQGALVQAEGSTQGEMAGIFRQLQNGRPGRAYNYWASPVRGFPLANFNDGDAAFRFYYDEPGGRWSRLPAQAVMETGRGYAITSAAFTGFSGQPHNGDVVFNQLTRLGQPGRAGYNLLGNPYPSGLHLATFLADNPHLTGVVWVWNGENQSLDQGNYLTISGLSTHNQVMAAGQGFFVRRSASATNSTVRFRNGQRTALNTSFFRQEDDLERLVLNLQRPDGLHDELVVGLSPRFTQGEDWFYDAEKLDGTQPLSLAVEQLNGRYAHAALPPPALADTFALPLSIRLNRGGPYTFALGAEAPAQRRFFIEDRQTGEYYYLTAGMEHSLELPAGWHRQRFYLRTSQETQGERPRGPAVFSQAGTVYLRLASEALGQPVWLDLLDLLGRPVAQTRLTALDTQVSWEPGVPQNGIYALKVRSQHFTTESRVWLGQP